MAYDTAKSRIKCSVIFMGQLVSLGMAAAGFFAQLMDVLYNANLPAAQMALTYCTLLFVYSSRYYTYNSSPSKEVDEESSEGADDGLDSAWWRKLIQNHTRLGLLSATIFDLTANSLYIISYHFTSLSSAGCTSVPIAMMLSHALFRLRYRWSHYLGVSIALTGMICIIYSDATVNDDHSFPHGWIGDITAVLGACFFALSDTLDEILVHEVGRESLLSSFGIYGTSISIVLTFILERDVIGALEFSWGLMICLVGFSASMFMMYSSAIAFYHRSTAVMVNLSLLTTNVYAVIATIFVFHTMPDFVYWIGFSCIIIGTIVYGSTAPREAPPKSNEYMLLTEE